MTPAARRAWTRADESDLAAIQVMLGPAMTIVVLYFAALRELLHTSEETVSGELGPLTVAMLADRLAERHPELGPHLGSVRFAVNESFVDRGAELADGDTVALIPPVSGG